MHIFLLDTRAGTSAMDGSIALVLLLSFTVQESIGDIEKDRTLICNAQYDPFPSRYSF